MVDECRSTRGSLLGWGCLRSGLGPRWTTASLLGGPGSQQRFHEFSPDLGPASLNQRLERLGCTEDEALDLRIGVGSRHEFLIPEDQDSLPASFAPTDSLAATVSNHEQNCAKA